MNGSMDFRRYPGPALRPHGRHARAPTAVSDSRLLADAGQVKAELERELDRLACRRTSRRRATPRSSGSSADRPSGSPTLEVRGPRGSSIRSRASARTLSGRRIDVSTSLINNAGLDDRPTSSVARGQGHELQFGTNPPRGHGRGLCRRGCFDLLLQATRDDHVWSSCRAPRRISGAIELRRGVSIGESESTSPLVTAYASDVKLARHDVRANFSVASPRCRTLR